MATLTAGVTVTTPLAFDDSSTIIAFTVDGCRGEEVAAFCEERGILDAAHLEQAVRISAHVYNTQAEVDRLVQAVSELHQRRGTVAPAAAEVSVATSARM